MIAVVGSVPVLAVEIAVVAVVVVVAVVEEGLGVSVPHLHLPNPEHCLNVYQTAYEY